MAHPFLLAVGDICVCVWVCLAHILFSLFLPGVSQLPLQ